MTILPRIIGVYKITCTPNGRIYIGSSVNITHRWRCHRSHLQRDRHHNKHLQKAWTQYGGNAFVFEVIEVCDASKVIEREQSYLDALKPFAPNGFNIALDACKVTLGRKRTPETRANISAALKGVGKGRRKSPETIARMSAAQKGRIITPSAREKLSAANKGKKATAETRAKQSITSSRRMYVVTSPIGGEITITNLTRFCQQNHLDKRAMIRVIEGEYTHHHGWQCRYAD